MQFIYVYLIEFLYFGIKSPSKIKKVLGLLLMPAVVFSTINAANTFELWVAVAVWVVLPFRLLNIGRAIEARMHPGYLQKATVRTALSLQVICLAVFAYVTFISISLFTYLPFLLLFCAVAVAAMAVWHTYKTRHMPTNKFYSDAELPTLSICVPARNETSALEECLNTLIASDYPKLEILVLDDCSQLNTPDIIKKFAHEGVRFVAGDEPQQRWLAKNQAYDKLLNEATGDFVLFCGVDVRMDTQAIRALVTTALNRNKSMVSVMPLRFYSKPTDALIQPMRYWWEVVPPRKLFRRPAVLSTCWLVNRKQLLDIGGFKSVQHAIIPEGFFARHFIKTDKYSFIRANSSLDIRTAKPFNEQWSTALRTNYPQIRRRPEMALILTFFTLMTLVLPYVMLPYYAFTANWLLAAVYAGVCALMTATHVLIVKISDPGNLPLALFSLPISALLEVYVGYASMFKYEFGQVEWKDRNVCIPVMHVIPKLPPLSNPNKSTAS